jgi:hypothetical protein
VHLLTIGVDTIGNDTHAIGHRGKRRHLTLWSRSRRVR